MKKAIAAALSAALILMSPGISFYEAAAGEINSAGARRASPSGPSVAPQLPALPGSAILGKGSVDPGAAIPGLNTPSAPAISVAPADPAAPGAPAAVQASAPSDGQPGAPKTTGQVSGAAPPKEGAAEASQRLADPKHDKVSVLSWLFDRLRRRSSSSLDENLPQGRPSGRRERLDPATARDPSAQAEVPAPARLSLKGFNRSEKAYIVGQSMFMLAASIYIVSMPLLVKALTGNTGDTGIIRMVHFWAMGFGSLFAGEIVSRLSHTRVLVSAGVGRAAIFGVIGGLALGGVLPMSLLAGLVGLNALLVAHNHLADIDAAGANKVFSSADKRRQGLRLYKTMKYSILLVMPWLLGLGMDRLDAVYGAGTGPKAGFLAFAALMSVTAWIYATRMRPAAQAVAASVVEKAASVWARGKAAAAAAAGLLAQIPARNWRTAKIIWGNKTVTIRLAMATVEQFLEDALFMVALPTFAVDVLRAGNLGNGLVLSAMYLGGLVTSMLLVRRAPKLERRLGAYRFIALLSAAAALAVVPSAALWLWPSMLVVLPAVALMKFLLDPIQTQMQSLLQEAIGKDPKTRPHEDNIFSFMTMLEVMATGAGGLAFAWLFKHSGPGDFMTTLLGANAPMKAITGMLAVFSVLYLGFLPLIKRQLSRSTLQVYHSKEGQEAEAYVKLAASLKKMGLPSYKTAVNDEPAGDRPTVAILAPASVYKLAIAREGARQSPGDVHLVLDPSWLTQSRNPGGRNTLLLTKGLTFDKDGQATIVTYSQPRPVHYFANFYTMGANDRDDGVPLEQDLDVPQSNSLQLEKITNDKLLTRLLLAAKGVAVPATLALLMSAHPLNAKAAEIGAGAASGVHVAAIPADREQIKSKLEDFLRQYKGAEVVVKPSGPQFHSARGVKFFARAEVDAMADHVLALKADKQMTDDGAVLIDGRLTPPALYLRVGEYRGQGPYGFVGSRVSLDILGKDEIPAAGAKQRKDWNLRVGAARTPWDSGATTAIFARAGTWGVPTAGEPADPADAAAIISLNVTIQALREQHGLLTSEAETAAFKADLERIGAQAIEALAGNEANRARAHGEPYQAQTDSIGLDVMVEVVDGRLVPYVIEVNDHDWGGQYQLDEFEPGDAGAHSREWMATALARASRDALKGKRIIVVGAGYVNKRFFLEKAAALGVEVILVDKGLSGWAKMVDRLRVMLGRPSRDNWARGLAKDFINVDTSRPEAVAKAAEAIRRLTRKGVKIDGITSYWEDDVLDTARLAAALGLRYHPVEAVETARSKHGTRQAMSRAGLRTPKSWIISTRADLIKALGEGFPKKAILKPEEGAEAQFTEEITRETALEVYDRLLEELIKSEDKVFKNSRNFILDTYLDGPETDVNIVLQNGRQLSATVTDNWPTAAGSKKATGSSLPSRAMTQEQLEHDKRLAVAALLKLGFTDGVFHVEMKGGDLLEINVRPGGSYTVEWDKAVFGVDEAEMLLLTAAGVAAFPFVPRKPRIHLEGAFMFSPKAGIVRKIGLTEKAKKLGLKILIEKKPGSAVTQADNRVAFVYAEGGTSEESLVKLEGGMSELLEFEMESR